MIEHLSNCHGEWNILFAALGSIPFIGVWLRAKLHKLTKKEKDNESRRLSQVDWFSRSIYTC